MEDYSREPAALTEVPAIWPLDRNGATFGRVETSDGLPMMAATIELRSVDLDSARVYSATTNVAASFRVQGLRPGDYRVRVHRIGYVPAGGVVRVDSTVSQPVRVVLKQMAAH